ncbi:hypothetical protein [Schnuerera ultunensis]|uniref:hypothetical protein n=1 Tax=Schnuerera ultunensis TaxID=45497 RepID=UPI000427D520|nr:hypothetical protein [Schnuerera ultunensis]
MRKNLIKVPLIIILIMFFIYFIGGYILENYFNLLLRGRVVELLLVVSALCIFVIEIGILIKLNGILEKVSTKKIWKEIIKIVSICLFILANLYAVLICIFIIGVGYEEIEILPANVKYIQKIDNDLNYGFYLIDRASHQYLYGFVKSKDNGVSWEKIIKISRERLFVITVVIKNGIMIMLEPLKNYFLSYLCIKREEIIICLHYI